MKIESLKTMEMENIPRELEEGIFYFSRKYALGIHLCACGCKGEVVTPLGGLNAWGFSETANGITLVESIGNQKWPCGSHYWVRDGQIIPC